MPSEQVVGTMQCPKCSAGLDTLKRHGVVIEQCPACQGVFLDRGELEQLIDAETEHLAENGYQGRHRGGIVQQIFEAG